MSKIKVIKDCFDKDELGNQRYQLVISANKLFSNDTYNVEIVRNEKDKISMCKVYKEDDKQNYERVELEFFEVSPEKNRLEYKTKNLNIETSYNLFKEDSIIIGVQKNKVKEFVNKLDSMIWESKVINEEKATFLDIITDVLDTLDEDYREVDGKNYTDADIVHNAIKELIAGLSK